MWRRGFRASYIPALLTGEARGRLSNFDFRLSNFGSHSPQCLGTPIPPITGLILLRDNGRLTYCVLKRSAFTALRKAMRLLSRV